MDVKKCIIDFDVEHPLSRKETYIFKSRLSGESYSPTATQSGHLTFELTVWTPQAVSPSGTKWNSVERIVRARFARTLLRSPWPWQSVESRLAVL